MCYLVQSSFCSAASKINWWMCVLTSSLVCSTCSHTHLLCPYTLWSMQEHYSMFFSVYLNVWPPYLIWAAFGQTVSLSIIVKLQKFPSSCPRLPMKDHNYYVKKNKFSSAYWHCCLNVSLVITEANMALPHSNSPVPELNPAVKHGDERAA